MEKINTIENKVVFKSFEKAKKHHHMEVRTIQKTFKV